MEKPGKNGDWLKGGALSRSRVPVPIFGDRYFLQSRFLIFKPDLWSVMIYDKGLLRSGQVNCEGAASAYCAFDSYTAFMKSDDMLYDCQSQPGAA
jgi:hypothetical protein